MLGSAFIDEIGSSRNCADFFDNIEDLLDFPMEEIEGDLVGGGVGNHFETSVWPGTAPSIEPSTTVFNNNSMPELDTGLSVPYEDFPQLEWMANFMEDSFSAGSIILDSDTTNDADKKNHTSSNIKSENFEFKSEHYEFNQFQTSSPVSVLESSSSCSGGKNTMPLNAESFIRGRARSKRPRPATFNPRPVIQLISPTSSITDAATTTSSEIGNHAESRYMMKLAEPGYMSQFEPKKKIKKIKIKKIKMPPLPGSMNHNQCGTTPSTAPVRKCLHCEITKTPQWRAGPLGPKTLCNACGVRYKSGRLYPEYRPAASPTFVASQHSNSHKKVLEMRIRTCEKMQKPTVEFLPKASHLLDEI